MNRFVYGRVPSPVNSAFSEGDTVQVVFDHYENDISIKAGERKHRANIIGSPVVIFHSKEQLRPSMKAH